MTGFVQISVVLPAKDEAACIGPVIKAIAAALDAIAHEIIVVDDGSGDATASIVTAMMPAVPGLRLIRHRTACGQSAALRSGILAARGAVIATLDADGQNPPDNLPNLVAPLLTAEPQGRPGLVQGQRMRRHDSWSKRFGSRIGNRIRGALLKDGVRDSGCGMKVFARETYLALPYFDHMHRFMPALIRREGLQVLCVDVSHQERTGGVSKYNNLQRALVGIVDLAGVLWLVRRRKLPEIETSGGSASPDGAEADAEPDEGARTAP
ncbi:MAG: glycosyltransferase family 2 protein [Paracoccaceae bacterium]|nr:glycosyltransferase family 2 protein [Paracoccaceae bacterium]